MAAPASTIAATAARAEAVTVRAPADPVAPGTPPIAVGPAAAADSRTTDESAPFPAVRAPRTIAPCSFNNSRTRALTVVGMAVAGELVVAVGDSHPTPRISIDRGSRVSTVTVVDFSMVMKGATTEEEEEIAGCRHHRGRTSPARMAGAVMAEVGVVLTGAGDTVEVTMAEVTAVLVVWVETATVEGPIMASHHFPRDRIVSSVLAECLLDGIG